MAEDQIRFEDGAAYERMMGVWSRLAGQDFLNWLSPPRGLRWIDVGCGNGAFTELLVERSEPGEVQGIDPSEAQIAFARSRPGARVAQFQLGDAMRLPFEDQSFDAAVMALVLFFVPDPAKGVSEMVRVVRPGGIVSAYLWDMEGGGFPNELLLSQMREMGVTPLLPPSCGASRMEMLMELWLGSGLDAIETREIAVKRTYADFEDYWASCSQGSNVRAIIARLASSGIDELKARLRARLPVGSAGKITCGARANAIKGVTKK